MLVFVYVLRSRALRSRVLLALVCVVCVAPCRLLVYVSAIIDGAGLRFVSRCLGLRVYLCTVRAHVC